MTAAPFESGDVLGGRYRLSTLLLRTPAADVFKADDLTLNRPVAIHVLPPSLVGDTAFLEAFRTEAVAVAALNHPHVLRVYDWGEEAGGAFLVTEYPAGGTLRELLDREGTLSEARTAVMGLEVADGLAYAHARGMVHGALSPTTIHFDADGRAKVADFGVAQVIANTRLGSPTDIRYASPEQATQAVVDGRTDVYALALTMYECVTGVIPHDMGEPTATLRQRINAPLPPHPRVVALDMVLAQAAVFDVRARWDAATFATRLQAVATVNPVVAAGPTFASELTALPADDRTPPLARKSRVGFNAPTADEVLTGSVATPPPATLAAGIDATRSVAEVGEFRNERMMTNSFTPSRRRRLLRTVLGLIIVLGGAGFGGAYAAGLFTPTHPVPALVGLTQQEALTLLTNDNFSLQISGHAYSSTVPSGNIATQVPASGASLKEGGLITVRLSQGAMPVAVPTSVIGVDCATATATLAHVGLVATCPLTVAVNSTRVPAGKVVKVFYGSQINPATVPKGSTVQLALSLGVSSPTTTTTTTPVNQHAPRAVPNFVGMSQSQVAAAMHLSEFFYRTNHPTGAWTVVVSQTPAPGTMLQWHGLVRLSVK